MPDNVQEHLLLHGDSRFDENKNNIILKTTINSAKNIERFSGSFFINISFHNNVQLLMHNSDHSVIKIFCVNYC